MYLSCNKKTIKIEDCTTFWKRFLGFMFQTKEIKEGKRFPKCSSIHTFFMFQPIDVIMTDQKQKIIYLYPNFKPGRIILPKKGVYYVYELPLEICSHYQVNDILEIKETD